MRLIGLAIFLIGTTRLFAQFPELDERYLEHVSKVTVWEYHVNKTTKAVTDSNLYNVRKFNKEGVITACYQYVSTDSTQYSAELYSYDTVANKQTIHYVVTKKFIPAYSFSGHPKKKIEQANDLGQLTETLDYGDGTEEVLKTTYQYDEKHRVVLVKDFKGINLDCFFKVNYK
jgi:hypothetical protein